MSGIHLNESKETLLNARIRKRLNVLKLDNYEDYLEYLLKENKGEEIHYLIDVVSTNVTSFFRGGDHFDFLSDAVMKWYNEGQRRFRFWSAASSTGEEPHSIAISLFETFKKLNTDIKSLDIKILATDIAYSTIIKCKDGIYSEKKIDTISPAMRNEYFDSCFNSDKNNSNKFYCVKDKLKDIIVFTWLNLSNPPFPMKGPFDIVFCRNVMIYFDNKVRQNLVNEIYRLVKPGGYLFVGHSESLLNVENSFSTVRPSIFIK